MSPELVAVILCLFGSAFFSASETALTSLPITRLEALRERSGRLTRRGLDRWAENPQHLLITILVGNNLVNVLASALATSLAYKLSRHGGLATVVGIMTLVILVFGEITPKSLAQVHAEGLSARVAGPLYVLDLALRPVNWVLGLLTRLLSRGHHQKVPVTEEDILFMLRLAHHHAQLPREARHMIESVLRFNDTVAREVMVPRPMVHTVDASWDLERLVREVLESGHTRFPVVEGSPDALLGVLHSKQLLGLPPQQPWTELMANPLFIPEAKPLPDLLQDFRRSGQHLAIVLDEFGGLSGVVSLEDALEIVVGEIEDEFDRGRQEGIVPAEGGFLVPAHLSLRRLERLLHRRLEHPDGIDSVGGVLATLADGPVEVGAAVRWRRLRLEVTEADEGRPLRILVVPVRR